ncbi:MAG TPA: AAA family ATPase [Xanthobacteraceae bacterium]|nr:AAA family ATPase [Xanthobacteraceae bacterium]
MSGAVHPEHRYVRGRRCPICKGADGDPRGAERRCHGFLSGDGYAHCSRDEHAGTLKLSEGSNTYGHRLTGPCGCGTTHGEATPPEASEVSGQSSLGSIVAEYDYHDENGALVYQVVRYEPKAFRQRRPDPEGGGRWIWSLKGTRRVLYYLDRVIEADPERVVYVVEGEKDVEALEELGLVATCNPQGAGKWRSVADCASKALKGRRVVVIADADDPGRRHAADVAAQLRGVAASVRVIEPRRGKDAADWIEAGGTVEEIEATAASAAADVASDMQSETTVDSDPFEAEVARALEEIQGALKGKRRTKRKPLFGVDAAHLLGEEFPEQSWRVHRLITRGGTTVIGGPPKISKKTWLALEIAVGVATGTSVCGEFYATQGCVACFMAEDTARQARNRIRALLRGGDRTIPEGSLYLQPRGEFIDVLNDDELAWIVASCRARGKIDLLILDPLSDIHSGEEDKRDSMRDVMRRLRLLGELLGCDVLAVHHASKPGENSARRSGGLKLRGSSAIHGSVDNGIYFVECDEGASDGQTSFTNIMESEIKGARSAGRFNLDLQIEDDDNHEAVCARWNVDFDVVPPPTKEEAKAKRSADKAKRHEEDDEKAFGFVRALAMSGQFYSQRKFREADKRPISDHRMRDALERLIEVGRLVIVGGLVKIPEPRQHHAS